jgi:uncharacterized membrane protein YtjA (UPF0391 family)
MPGWAVNLRSGEVFDSWPVRRSPSTSPILLRPLMLELAILFFVIAIILGVFGFRGAASGFASLAKILFVVFLILAVVAFFL